MTTSQPTFTSPLPHKVLPPDANTGVIALPPPRDLAQPYALCPNIVAIASGKGGVGKTWLSITLAHHLARAHKRVLLFDGDLGLANVDVQLGLIPPRDLTDMFRGKYTLNDIVYPYAEGRFDIIAGRSGSASLGTLPATSLNALCSQLARLSNGYDAVLIDLGAGVEKNVRALAGLGASCLVVVTDEPTSLTDAYAFIKLLVRQSPKPRIHIVVNQAATRKEGEKTFTALVRACENFLHYTPELAGIIRRDKKVRDAIRAQETLIKHSAYCTAATDAAALSARLLEVVRDRKN